MQSLLDKLQNIDVDARITELQDYINANKHKGPDKIDKQVKALKVLRELKNNGTSPYDAFTRDTVPVIPAQFRAPIQLPNNTFMVPDVNDLLRNIGMMSDSLNEIKDDLPPNELEKARRDLYNNVAALQGLEVPKINNQIKKNYYATISGSPGPAKSGYVQSSLTKKRVDLSGRGVISPNPQLDMDQVELPIDMGMTMYKPFVKRELISRGYDNDKANKLIKSKDPIALDALQRTGNQRPVLLNRAPSITEGSITAHYPIFVDKYNVNIPNVLAQYILGDFDGDSVGIHVPVSQQAIAEAERMMPSKTMYNEVADKIRGFPDHSAAIGLYILSKTPEGRSRINDMLPDQHRIDAPMAKPQLTRILTEIAKEDSTAASVVVDNLLRLGDGYAYDTGYSFGLEDIAPLVDLRKGIMKQIKGEIKSSKDKSPDKLREIYKRYSDIASSAITDHYKDSDNPIGDLIMSKARGSASQIRDLIFSPISVNAAEKTTKPIAHSYIEGLTPAEYFSSAAGARAGTIGKSQGTAQPGALGKILFANTNMLVINKDKGSSMGSIRLSTEDDAGDLLDRYLSEDIKVGNRVLFEKETVVTPRVIQMARKHNIKELPVYSALGSSSSDGGIPAMSYGIIQGNKLPEVGYNIGAHASAGIVSPLYTESMQSFHTGGSLQDRDAGYPRLKQVLELTKSIGNKATLSSLDGTVSDIRKDTLGGHTVIIEGVDHFVSPNNKVTVGIGGTVNKGMPISDGPSDPRDIARLKDLPAAQKYMVEELVKNTPGHIKRRAAEVVVEGLTRYAEVTDPGESEYLPGDIKLISEIEKRNRDIDDKVKYETVFRGVNTLPLYSQQWMSQLNFRNIKKSLSNAISTGGETNIHSYEPAPALAWSTEFGDGEDGRY